MIVSPDFSITIPDYDIKNKEFVSYFVQVKALTDKGKSLSNGIKSWCVSRRFSEFYSLHEMLEMELPTCLLPPLPPKQDGANSRWYKFASAIGARTVGNQVPLDSIPGAVIGKRFDNDLVDSRRQALELFLNRCVSHPRISKSPILLSFLRNCDDWMNVKLDVSNMTNCEKESDLAVIDISGLSTNIPLEPLAQKAQEMLDHMKHFVDLRRQIRTRLGNLNHINKQVADALHHWCPHENQNHIIADSIQTLAHNLDSYHIQLNLVGEEEAEVDERLQGHMRYTAALSELCAREVAIRQGIAAERAALLQFQTDIQALQNGTRPEFIPSLVGPMYSMTNTLISGLKTIFLSNQASASITERVSPEEIEQALKQLNKKIEDTTMRLAELEGSKADFKASIAEEYAFFEKQQSEDLATTMRIYAAQQLQRAEKCKRLWERAHYAMLNAVDALQIPTSSKETNEPLKSASTPQSVLEEPFRPATLP